MTSCLLPPEMNPFKNGTFPLREEFAHLGTDSFLYDSFRN